MGLGSMSARIGSVLVSQLKTLLILLLKVDEFLLKYDGFLLKNGGFLLKNDCFLLTSDDFLLKNDGFVSKRRRSPRGSVICCRFRMHLRLTCRCLCSER